jgi:hypothetical protein
VEIAPDISPMLPKERVRGILGVALKQQKVGL